MAVVQGVKKSRLGCWFQRHWPVHVVIVGPDESYLVERQHRDLLEVQPVQLHSEGMGRVHGGDPRPGRGQRAPDSHGTSDKPASTRTRNVSHTVTRDGLGDAIDTPPLAREQLDPEEFRSSEKRFIRILAGFRNCSVADESSDTQRNRSGTITRVMTTEVLLRLMLLLAPGCNLASVEHSCCCHGGKPPADPEAGSIAKFHRLKGS